MYTLKSLREFCTKFTSFGYKYCIELSKRFCKLVVIYAVKEFCAKYLTSELKCIKVKDTANWLLFMQIPICMHNLMILKCQQCIKTIIYALKSLHLKCKVIAFCILEML